MIRIKLLELRIKLLSFIVCLALFFTTLVGTWFILYSLFSLSASAEEASSSATQSGSLIQKLNTLKSEIASKAAQLKIDVNKKIQNKVVVGFAKDKSGSSIVLASRNGDKTIILNEYTVYESKARKPSLDDLDKNDYIAALGDMDDKNNLVAKKIVWLPKPNDDSKVFFWGQVQALNGTSITIKTKDGQKNTIFTSHGTDFGVDNDEALLSDVKVNKFISGVGISDTKENIQANFVYIIPTGGILRSEKIKSASPSAKTVY